MLFVSDTLYFTFSNRLAQSTPNTPEREALTDIVNAMNDYMYQPGVAITNKLQAKKKSTANCFAAGDLEAFEYGNAMCEVYRQFLAVC
ncbi:hypothetical protein [Ktedonospora formicarum]|uniref:Uncharacterized protein n=1 Tax=Ktedonospora formicarum TaxID=2778364 RepID=A0A8J3MR07_9CHLR|nr:hypothetical protein [Ktedonospora formicarum]GHO44530.1 hypothetical protein KSX_26930 [Ktedonospora formicarum]